MRKKIGNGIPNRVVYPGDADYPQVFSRLFGSGQATTVRQIPRNEDTERTADAPVEPEKEPHRRPVEE